MKVPLLLFFFFLSRMIDRFAVHQMPIRKSLTIVKFFVTFLIKSLKMKKAKRHHGTIVNKKKKLLTEELCCESSICAESHMMYFE